MSVELRLADWLAEKLPGAKNIAVGSLVSPSGTGNSAETSFVTVRYLKNGQSIDHKLVLRRQNLDNELFLDASLELPGRMMIALGEHPVVPVPRVLGIELDATLLGRPFMVMEAIEGRVVSQAPPYNVAGWLVELSSLERAQIWGNGLRAMAAVHSIDRSKGFSFLQRDQTLPPGLGQYIDWVRRWYLWARRDRPQPVADAALDYLLTNMPLETPVDVLWGDSQPSNLIYASDNSVAGVLDWEMAALGPGEVDLAWWLFFDDFYGPGFGLKRLDGLPTRSETIAIYQNASGRTVQNMDYYDLLARFRMNIISIRATDRLVAAGKLAPDVDVFTHNPITKMMAIQLGLPVPEPGSGFKALLKAFDVNQEPTE